MKSLNNISKFKIEKKSALGYLTFILPFTAGFTALCGTLTLHMPQAVVHCTVVNVVTEHFNLLRAGQ